MKKGELQSAESLSHQGHEGDTMASQPEWEFDVNPKKRLGEPPLFIEACCGCALLSACAAKMGFDILPIDFQGTNIGLMCMLLNWTCESGLHGIFWNTLLSQDNHFTSMARHHAAQLLEQETFRYQVINMDHLR